MQNWLKDIAFLVFMHRALEWGLANESNRPQWIGYSGEEPTGRQRVADKQCSLTHWNTPMYAISLMTKYAN